MHEHGASAWALRAGKGISFFMSNEDLDDVIRMIKSLETSGVLGVTETVKQEINKKKVDILLLC